MACLACARLSPAHAEGAGLRFLVVGDWGRRHSQNQYRVAKVMGKVASIDRPRFVISTGDNFYPRGVASADDPLWSEAFEQVYTDETLQCPWYAVLGNHDYKGNEDAEIAYSARSSRWNMPARYFSHIEPLGGSEAVEFFFLDTTPIVSHHLKLWTLWFDHADPDRQVEWLQDSLRKSTAKWKIVVGHHPIVSAGPHFAAPELVEKIQPLMERYGVQAYFNGHEHNLQHHTRSGVNYFICGAGHELRPATQDCAAGSCSNELGFMSAKLTPSQLSVEFIGIDAQVLHSATVSPA